MWVKRQIDAFRLKKANIGCNCQPKRKKIGYHLHFEYCFQKQHILTYVKNVTFKEAFIDKDSNGNLIGEYLTEFVLAGLIICVTLCPGFGKRCKLLMYFYKGT